MNNLQEKVKEFIEKYKIGHPLETEALDLVAEIGEVAKEILKSTNYGEKSPEPREEMKSELGDAFYSLIKIANFYQVDLEEALEMVLQKYGKRLQKGSADSENE